MGQVLGPVFGSNVAQYYGYRFSQDMVALIFLIFLIIYLTFGGGMLSLKNQCCSSRKKIANERLTVILDTDIQEMKPMQKTKSHAEIAEAKQGKWNKIPSID